MDSVERFHIQRINGEGRQDAEGMLIREIPLTIILNNQELVTLLCSPTCLSYLAVGFLASEGLLDGFMAVVIPLYVASQVGIGLPETIAVGILLSLTGLVDSVLLPFTGIVSDRARNRKLFIQLGRALIILALFLFTCWSNFYILAILRIIMGIGIALLLPSSLRDFC